MTSEYHRPRGMRWQPHDRETHYWRWVFLAGALILAGCAVWGCASPRAELALKGRVFPMDAAECERLAVKTGGVCYAQ